MTKEVTVNKKDLLQAVEFACSSNFSHPEGWMYFDGIYCLDFFYEDVRPSHRDLTGYDEWLKLCGTNGDGLEDTDENYYLWLDSVREAWELDLQTELEIEGEEIKVEYI